MTTPDLFASVGFRPQKLGPGDKELGYAISRSSLTKIATATLILGVIVSTALFCSRFEVHFERRAFRHALRRTEHHAAKKLVQVELELWAHYRDDIQESREAAQLLRSLNSSYSELQAKLRGSIDATAKDLGLAPAKASGLADRLLGTLADHRQENAHHVKRLIDHLVEAGRRSTSLEKRLDKKITHEMQHEQQEEEKAAEIDAQEQGWEDDGPDDEEHELRTMLNTFFEKHKTFLKRFAGASLDSDSPVYAKLMELKQSLENSPDEAMPEEALLTRLRGLDLSSANIDLEAMAVRPQDAEALLQEMLALPMLRGGGGPIGALEEAWRAGKDPYDVLSELHELEEGGKVPESWLEQSLETEEDTEEEEEEPGDEVD